MSIATTMTTTHWQDLLATLVQRNGAIMLYQPHPDNDLQPLGPDRCWKVRLLAIDEGDLIVEQPLGLHRIPPQLLADGHVFHAIIADDNSRWGFQIRLRERTRFTLNTDTILKALRFSPPYNIGSAQRRNFFRITTVSPDLGPVRLWPLLDPASAIDAENFNRQMFQLDGLDESAMYPPQLGPSLDGPLVDISGGGALIHLDGSLRDSFTDQDLFWLRLGLPQLEHPLYVRSLLVRTTYDRKLDALFVGFQFVYNGNLHHRHFIEKHVCRFIAERERLALQRQR